MSGNINKLIFLFVGIFLSILLVAFFLGRFKLTPSKDLNIAGALGGALGFKEKPTQTPTPIAIAILPTQMPPINIPPTGGVLGSNNPPMILVSQIPTPTKIPTYGMQYAPVQIPNTGSPLGVLGLAGTMLSAGVYLVRKYS